jgi:hypothetical protein
MDPIYRGDTPIFTLTLVQGDGLTPPTGGTLSWVVEHCLKLDDDDATVVLSKTNQTPGEIDAATPNPGLNLWEIKYQSADTNALDTGTYVWVVKVTTDTGQVVTIEPLTLEVLPEACP